jgi:aconitate hydratase
MLRKKGVVDKFVEFFGDGLANLPLADRATIANMAPGVRQHLRHLPDRRETLRYLELSGRSAEQIALVEAYAKAQGMWRDDGQRRPRSTPTCSNSTWARRAELAGPKRPQDRVPLRRTRKQATARVRRWPRSAARRTPPPPASPVTAVGGSSS